LLRRAERRSGESVRGAYYLLAMKGVSIVKHHPTLGDLLHTDTETDVRVANESGQVLRQLLNSKGRN
jgi:hypothetical protein